MPGYPKAQDQRIDKECGGTPPAVSIIIPVPRDMPCPAALEALRGIDYPEERFEVILARGSHPSRQRNMAAAKAEGEILLFLDDDSLVDRDMLWKNTSFYTDPRVACVGGPDIDVDGTGPLTSVMSRVLSSAFADPRGSARFARRGSAREAEEDGLILCNTSVRKAVFQEVGGFPEALYPNEENALFRKILRAAGKEYKLIYTPDAFVRRPRPAKVREFAAKIFRYGVGRMTQTFFCPSSVCALRSAAALFPLYWLIMPFVNLRVAAASALAYLLSDMAVSLKMTLTTRSLGEWAMCIGLFPVLHTAYGTGIIWGAVRGLLGIRKRRDSAVDVVHVKRLTDRWSTLTFSETVKGPIGNAAEVEKKSKAQEASISPIASGS